MRGGRADEQDEGDTPSSLLAPPDAPAEQQETEAGESDDNGGSLGDGQGNGRPQNVEPIPQRRCEGRYQVEDTGRSDRHCSPAADALKALRAVSAPGARARFCGLVDLGRSRHARSSEGRAPSAADPMKCEVSTI